MLVYIQFLWSLLFLHCLNLNTPATEPDLKKSLTIVENTGFVAISDGKKVILSWSAGAERRFDYFTIERSKDGIHFVNAVRIKGPGKTATSIDYTDIDFSPYAGISYYRLKQTDAAGESCYSETLPVNFRFGKDGSMEPNADKLPDTQDLRELENKPLLVIVKDAKGLEFISKVRVVADRQNLYATDDKQLLSQGAYLVLACSNNRLCNQTLFVR